MGARLTCGVASGLRPRVILLEVAVFYLYVGCSCFYLLVDVDVRASVGVLAGKKGLHARFLLGDLQVCVAVLVAQRRVRSDVRALTAVGCAFYVVFSFLDRSGAFLPILYLPFDLSKHDWETAKPVLVPKLLLVPEATLVVVESLLPLACIGTARHIGSVRYHVEEGLALVANGWHVRLLFLEAVLMLLPPLAELDVAEFGYLRQLLLGLFRLFAEARSDDIGRQLGLPHEALVSFSFVHLENIFVSCSADHAVLALVPAFWLWVVVRLGGRAQLDAGCSLRAALVRQLAPHPIVQALLRTHVGDQIGLDTARLLLVAHGLPASTPLERRARGPDL